MPTNRSNKTTPLSGVSGDTQSPGVGSDPIYAAGAPGQMPGTPSDAGIGSTGRGQPWPSSDAGGNGSDGTTGRGLIDGLQQRVKSSADQQKNRAAEGLGGIAQVFQNAGNEMRSENEMLASYVDMAGDRLRRFADQVRERGVDDMLEDVQRFARRRPGLFIGGAFLVGLGLARFMKSSGDRRYDGDGDEFAGLSTQYGMPGSAAMPSNPPTYSTGELGDERY